MSDPSLTRYKDKKQSVAYINGFLCALEILNEDTNRGQTYYVEEITRMDNYEESIKKHLDDPNYVISLNEVLDWKAELEKTSISFFEFAVNKTESIDKQNSDNTKPEATNFAGIHEKYISLMNELICDNSKFYEVFVNWQKGAFYECHYKDYLIDNEKGLFFVHFGESD